MGHDVVVGYAEPAASRSALRWAVLEATTYDLDLVVCHAWDVPYASSQRQLEDVARAFATATVDEGVLLARQSLPPERVRSSLVHGPAPQALVRTGRGATMLVMGTSGPRVAIRPRSPTVSRYAARRAECPVVVVREGVPPPGDTVVVALADETPDAAAVGFGFRHAATYGADLLVLAAYGPPPGGQGAEHQRLDASLASWRERYPAVRAKGEVVIDRPLSGRLSLEDDARLLVVSHPDLLGPALLGHPTAPVAVVRAGQ